MPRPTPTQKLALTLLLTVPALAATPSSTTLHSTPNPSRFGTPVTLTATVGPPGATGKVTFYSGTTVLETAALVNGTASLDTILLPFGAQPLKAFYSGDATYSTSTSAVLTQTVVAVPGGSFDPVVSYPTSKEPGSVAVADFNADGKADLAVGTEAGVDILIGNGDGTFQPAVTYLASGGCPPSCYRGVVAVGDFNGDGYPDIAYGNPYSSALSILLGNGDGTFQAAVNETPFDAIFSFAVGDFNGDGKADLAVGNFNNYLTILLGNGDGTFTKGPTYITNDDNAGTTVVADFNGDGNADLAMCGGVVSIFLGNGDGTFQAPVRYALGRSVNSIVTADFNADGNADLAVNSGRTTFAVLLGNGNGTFQRAQSYPAGNQSTAIVVADFNGDGKTDVASIGPNMSVTLGNGDGTFQTPVIYAGNFYGPFASADFNGDGRADVAVSNSQTASAIGVYLAIPTGETATALASSVNPSSYGQPVTLTATLSPLSATGTVSFYSNSGSLGKVPLTNGIATLTTSSLSAGNAELTAIFNGDAGGAKSASAVLMQTVDRAATFTGLTSSPNPSNLNQTVTITATVSSTTATGTVTFYHGSSVLGTGTVSNGIAALMVSTLSSGKHIITAAYSGDRNYLSSTSPSWVQTVSP